MSESSDCKQSIDSAPRKRCPSPGQSGEPPVPSKLPKADGAAGELPFDSHDNEKKEGDVPVSAEARKHNGKEKSELHLRTEQGDESSVAATVNTMSANSTEKAQTLLSETRGPGTAKVNNVGTAATADYCRPSTSLDQTDSAAIAAAEALASLTRGDATEKSKETPCSSHKVEHEKQGNKVKRSDRDSAKERSKHERGFQAQAAAADSSTSVRVDREETEEDMLDEDDDSLPGTSSTPSSSFLSDPDEYDDGECAIVSVKMAPNIRKSLERLQMRLYALERKRARFHQQLELKINRHLDERSTITKAIPGFWVTALKHHPHLSDHIDETDEDALSYMTDLEIKSFKNNKLGYQIGFHFRANPYFKNPIIVKELHLGGGSPVSFSNPILWRRGQNLTAGDYATFFSWFSDHSNPGRDDIAQILKEDLYKNPLRYYLTPHCEPRENGSYAPAADNNSTSKGEECVVISSDSEDGQGETGRDHSKDDEEDDDGADDADDEQRGSDGETGRGHSKDDEEDYDDDDDDDVDGEQRGSVGGSDSDEEVREEELKSYGEKNKEVDVEDTDESSRGKAVRPHEEDEKNIEVDKESQS